MMAEFLFSSSFWPPQQGSHSDEQHPTVLKICTCNNGPYDGMSSHVTRRAPPDSHTHTHTKLAFISKHHRDDQRLLLLLTLLATFDFVPDQYSTLYMPFWNKCDNKSAILLLDCHQETVSLKPAVSAAETCCC